MTSLAVAENSILLYSQRRSESEADGKMACCVVRLPLWCLAHFVFYILLILLTSPMSYFVILWAGNWLVISGKGIKRREWEGGKVLACKGPSPQMADPLLLATALVVHNVWWFTLSLLTK